MVYKRLNLIPFHNKSSDASRKIMAQLLNMTSVINHRSGDIWPHHKMLILLIGLYAPHAAKFPQYFRNERDFSRRLQFGNWIWYTHIWSLATIDDENTIDTKEMIAPAHVSHSEEIYHKVRNGWTNRFCKIVRKTSLVPLLIKKFIKFCRDLIL